MVKICEYCKKEFEPKNGERQRFCCCSCSAKWRNQIYKTKYLSYWTEERRKQQSIRATKQNLDPVNNKKIRQRMRQNNPIYKPGVVEKIQQTKVKHNTVGWTGEMANTRGGNGKMSKAEELADSFLQYLGFQFNKAIAMTELRQKYPDKHFAYSYKPDFTNLDKKICIEIDGYAHKSTNIQEKDRKKEFALSYYGFTVYRFTNNEVMNSFDKFKKDVLALCGFSYHKIINIQEQPNCTKMYDLEVQDNHNYFGNNILVHNCKNLQSAQGQGIMALDKSVSKVGMTGTLLVNNPYDLYCPMSFVGLINYNKYIYERKFVIKDEFGQVIGYQNMDELHNILYKSSIRRTKDILDLPDKMFKQEWLDFEDSERKVFNQILGTEPFKLDKIDEPMETFAVITRMRQATVASELLTSGVKTSTKFNRLNDILEEAKMNGQKVLVFCPFTEALKLGLEYCKEYKPKLVCGGMGSRIQEVVDEHENTEGFSVIFAQEATLGVGYTLINTEICVFLSPPWNRATYDQCADRIHRIGQKKTVQIIDLLIQDTYDELIYKKLWGKGAMSDVVIDGDEIDSLRKYFDDINITFTKDEYGKVTKTLLDG